MTDLLKHLSDNKFTVIIVIIIMAFLCVLIYNKTRYGYWIIGEKLHNKLSKDKNKKKTKRKKKIKKNNNVETNNSKKIINNEEIVNNTIRPYNNVEPVKYENNSPPYDDQDEKIINNLEDSTYIS